MKTKNYEEQMDSACKFLMFGCTIASFQFVPLVLMWFTNPGFRFITKWLFLFPALAWAITFVVFAVMMFKLEYGSQSLNKTKVKL